MLWVNINKPDAYVLDIHPVDSGHPLMATHRKKHAPMNENGDIEITYLATVMSN